MRTLPVFAYSELAHWYPDNHTIRSISIIPLFWFLIQINIFKKYEGIQNDVPFRNGCRQGKITFGLIKCKKVDQICKLRMIKGLKNGLIQDLASHIDAVRHDSKFTSKGPRTEKSPSQLFFSKHLNIQLFQFIFFETSHDSSFWFIIYNFQKDWKEQSWRKQSFVLSCISIKIQLLLDRWNVVWFGLSFAFCSVFAQTDLCKVFAQTLSNSSMQSVCTNRSMM